MQIARPIICSRLRVLAMARLARIVVPGLSHHVVHRARPDVVLFRDQTEYARFEELLKENCLRYGAELGAYCLMPDHVHIVLLPRTTEALARSIGETGRLYTRYRGLGGAQLWQGRFRSCPLDEDYVKPAVAYVTANPVRARLGAWKWSYPARTKATASAEQIETIRRSTRSGRPAGSAEFYTRLEYDLGRSLAPKKRGRRAKW